MLATLRLFKALPVSDKNKTYRDSDVDAKTIPMGFVFSAEVLGNYSDTSHLIKMVDDLYGRDPQKLNKAFHKSFSKVRDTPMEQLVLEQVLHYMTTYGAEHYGVYNEDRVFIPAEMLDAPEITDALTLVVIKGYTTLELKDKLLKLLSSGVALGEESVQDSIEVATLVGLSTYEIEQVKNREVKAALYKQFGLVPTDPVEFLRYVVADITGSGVLIKNKDLVSKISAAVTTQNALPLFMRYDKEAGLARLGEIFYRYKPLFLAFRSSPKMRPVINKIRRAANETHKPMKGDYLNEVTARLKDGTINLQTLHTELAKANTFRKIRLAQALRVRLNPSIDSIVYRVRNGKSYATGFKFDAKSPVLNAYDMVVNSLVDDVRAKVNGKTVFIPAGVNYGLPATEKQFTGNLPSGTYVDVPGDMVAGIYWEDQAGNRIDLDLSMLNAAGKIGWDGSYRSGNEIFFSGDNTSAPKGASEVFHVGQGASGIWTLGVNYFNFNPSVPVPFKIVVGSEGAEAINSQYVIDSNHLLAASSSVMDVKQKNLGIIVIDGNIRRFYFTETNIGGGISARNTGPAEQARKYLYQSLISALTLNEILVRAGVNLVDDPANAELDLSPEAVDKTTLLELLS